MGPLRLCPIGKTGATRKGLQLAGVRRAWRRACRWKSFVRPVEGESQGCPSWGGIWRKLMALDACQEVSREHSSDLFCKSWRLELVETRSSELILREVARQPRISEDIARFGWVTATLKLGPFKCSKPSGLWRNTSLDDR